MYPFQARQRTSSSRRDPRDPGGPGRDAQGSRERSAARSRQVQGGVPQPGRAQRRTHST